MDIHKISKFIDDDKKYFKNCRMLIKTQNDNMLIRGCIIYALILMVYTFFCNITKQPMILRQMYYVYDAIHILLCIVVFTRSKKLRKSVSATQIYCIIFEFTVLSFFALEGAFTSHTEHSLYVPIAILLIQLLFIHKSQYTSLITILYLGAFLIFSGIYKTHHAFTNDAYIAIATFLSANIGYVMIATIRHNSGQTLCKYEYLSRIDLLTGLYNKIACKQKCEEVMYKTENKYAMIIIDVDDFKRINDKYGHATGDDVLKFIALKIKKIFDNSSIVGRFGGDEFIVFTESYSDIGILEKCLDNLNQEIKRGGFDLDMLIQCSAGIALKHNNDNFNTLFRRADHALYSAKNQGKGCYVVE